MKKTLLATLDFYPAVGGVSYYWMKLMECMPADRFVVLAPPLKSGTTEMTTKHRIIRKPFLSRWMRPRWIVLLWTLLLVLYKERPQMVIVGQILPVGTAVWLLSFFTRIPYIVSCHGMDIMLPQSSRKRWLMRKIVSRSCGVIANSHYTGRAVQSLGVLPEKISYVYPCPVRIPNNDKPVEPKSSNGHTLLTICRLVKRKGHEYVIRALPEVLKQYPDTIYNIIGDGPHKKQLEALVGQMGLDAYVRFFSGVSDDEVLSWYQGADMFIMTPVDLEGDIEGFGIVYLEANVFGLPVIATDSGGVGEAVQDGETGLLVTQRDVSAISGAIIRLFDNPALARQLGMQGKERVRREFGWDMQAHTLTAIIERTML